MAIRSGEKPAQRAAYKAASNPELVSSGTSGAQDGRPPRWTVMVFMSAHSVPGEAASLVDEAKADIAEMEKVGSNQHVNVFYQLHGAGIPERRHVAEGGVREPVPDGLRDNTSGQALVAFVMWALGLAEHRPTDYSLLVLWGHAYRFGFSPEVTKTGIDAVDFEELARVLRAAQQALQGTYQAESPPKLDIIGFDACDLATVEMAIQLREYADYLLASQVGIPLPGWPYHRVLERLAKPEGRRLMGPAEFGSYAVRRYCESYKAPTSLEPSDPNERAVSLTLLDLKQTPQLFALTETLARELAIAMDDDVDELSLVSELFFRSQTSEEKPFVDVANLCLNLFRYSGSEGVKDAAQRLGNLLVSAAPVVPGQSLTGTGRPFVVDHGRNSLPAARLHGVSLYAPHIALDTHDPASASHWYEKFLFAKQTIWNELVRALAQPA